MSLRGLAASLYRFGRLAGVDPLRARDLAFLPRYLRDRREFRRQGGVIDRSIIHLDDFNAEAGGASGHYFHQDLLVAQRIYEANPAEHVDVGSRIDGFVAHIAVFRTIHVLDIRPLKESGHSNIRFIQADLMNPLEQFIGRYPSVSCLHALEHFGLGRYSDPVDVEGHRRGFDAVARMVAPEGTLYLSVPVGRKRVEFNAHRIFDPAEPADWASAAFTLSNFDFVDDGGDLHRNASPNDAAASTYGCGIYTFRKKPSGS